MKVLYIVSLFPCWSETFIVRELLALRKQGLEIEIFSLRPHREELVHEDARSLLDHVKYPSNILAIYWHCAIMFLRRPLINIKLLSSIIKSMIIRPKSLIKSVISVVLSLDMAYRIRCSKPHRIHAHWATYPSTSALVLSENLDIPFGLTCHAHDIFLENHLLSEKIHKADIPVTISEFNMRYIASNISYGYQSKLSVIHCGVDLKEFPYTETERTGNRIISVGRLDEIKGFKYLISACKLLKEHKLDFECMVIGDGPLRPKLEAQIKAADLQQCFFLKGALPQHEVRKWISRACAFVLPSVQDNNGNMDGIPVVLMEAMALGTPVVTTCVSGIPELVEHQKTGLLCRPRQVRELADSIKSILSNFELRMRLSKAARSKVEQDFDAKKEAEKLARLFREAA